MTGKPTVRPAILGDFAALNLDAPGWRVWATTGLIDEEVVCIGGIAYMPDGSHVAFMHAKDSARGYRVLLHKTAVGIIAQARKRGIRMLVAVADEDVPRAEAWLGRLGFKQETIAEQKVWIWHSSSPSSA